MSLETDLSARSGGVCELCSGAEAVAAFEVAPSPHDGAEGSAHLCAVCRAAIESDGALDARHWRCLNTSAWSPTPAIQVLAWRLLQRLDGEDWARDLGDMIYLDEETLAWAKAGQASSESSVEHRDSNGALLASGDTVTLIKDLPVKGAGFTAKRGTAVRRISLVPDNPEQITGRVDGQQIVILTQFVKKSG